jgi:hypothetical protein
MPLGWLGTGHLISILRYTGMVILNQLKTGFIMRTIRYFQRYFATDSPLVSIR